MEKTTDLTQEAVKLARFLGEGDLEADITRAIVQGAQPPTLTARVLAKASRLPLDWGEQRRLLGFD